MWKVSESPEFYFPEIPAVTEILLYGGEGERKILLEMSGTLGGCTSVGNMQWLSFEHHTVIPNFNMLPQR